MPTVCQACPEAADTGDLEYLGANAPLVRSPIEPHRVARGELRHRDPAANSGTPRWHYTLAPRDPVRTFRRAAYPSTPDAGRSRVRSRGPSVGRTAGGSCRRG